VKPRARRRHVCKGCRPSPIWYSPSAWRAAARA
jgi:hypothetical protein